MNKTSLKKATCIISCVRIPLW